MECWTIYTYFSPFCQIPLKNLFQVCNSFQKLTRTSISWKRLIFIQFQKAYLCTKHTSCICHYKEAPHNGLCTSCICFRSCAWCFMFLKIQLEVSWFDQLTSKLFYFTMIIISPLPSPPRIYVLSLWPHPKSVMKLYKPRAYSRNFTVFNLCFTVALQWLTT